MLKLEHYEKQCLFLGSYVVLDDVAVSVILSFKVAPPFVIN